MDLLNFNEEGIFYRVRAYGHAYGKMSKWIVFSISLITLPIFLSAASKDELFTKLNQDSDAKIRIADLGRLTASHLNAQDVPKIEPFLQDSDPKVRAQTIVTLGSIGGKQAVVDIQKVLLTDHDAGVRIACAFWLGSLRDDSSVPALDKVLARDPDANVRTAAAQALKQIGTSGAKNALGRGKSDVDKRVKRLANEP